MKPYYGPHAGITIYHGDCKEVLSSLESGYINCCVTSPPYWGLRDYGVNGQLGLERTPEEYVANMVQAFREVKRVLRDDGTLWLNIGDSYFGSYGSQRTITNGSKAHQKSYDGLEKWRPPAAHDKMGDLKAKDLVGIPWMLAFALRADGWYLRQDIIWAKPNPMPESVRDRCTRSHEYIFLLGKSARYYYDGDAIAQKCKPATFARLSQQNLPNQHGSDRVPGKTNGPMKACFGGRIKSVESRKHTRLQSGREDNGNYLERGANKRSVWTVTTKPFKGAHFATFPRDLIEPCILAGCPVGGTVLDPFIGSGTTALVAQNLKRNAVGVELNAAYIEIAAKRLMAVEVR